VSGRPPLSERHRKALTNLLRNGAHATLGTIESRDVFADGIEEAVALLGVHFTPEELDIIADGAE
jgi:hypothetical protein